MAKTCHQQLFLNSIDQQENETLMFFFHQETLQQIFLLIESNHSIFINTHYRNQGKKKAEKHNIKSEKVFISFFRVCPHYASPKQSSLSSHIVSLFSVRRLSTVQTSISRFNLSDANLSTSSGSLLVVVLLFLRQVIGLFRFWYISLLTFTLFEVLASWVVVGFVSL